MRIVKRSEFLKLPAETIYSKYEHFYFQELQIKLDSLRNDWLSQRIEDSIESESSADFTEKLILSAETGVSLKMDFCCVGRDGCFESNEKLFAVWERADVEALIKRLQETLEKK